MRSGRLAPLRNVRPASLPPAWFLLHNPTKDYVRDVSSKVAPPHTSSHLQRKNIPDGQPSVLVTFTGVYLQKFFLGAICEVLKARPWSTSWAEASPFCGP